MPQFSLKALSPVDGRYHKQTKALAEWFSEYALMKYRVRVEMEYYIMLCEQNLPQLQVSPSHFNAFRQIYHDFSIEDCITIKETEKTTNHDVKAVEYFIKDRLKAIGIGAETEFVHFALTSQDINNTAIPLSLKEFTSEFLLPKFNELLELLKSMASELKGVSMLAHTHGQPASPTLLGKEIYVFVERLAKQLDSLSAVKFAAKFGGATGNFNAHVAAYPGTDWAAFADSFVNSRLGLERSRFTTQIEHYDRLAEYCDALRRINIILIDFCRDIWQYISMGYFKQSVKAGEIGSSAMPHKVNPIDFENAEGNLGIANALLEHFSNKLPISRLQRDLTDSTVLRNLGVPMAHVTIALGSLLKGLPKLTADHGKISSDLDRNAVVIAEAIQTVLRREGYPKPYEALKELTRHNNSVSLNDIHDFIDTLNVSGAIKAELKSFTPSNYTGLAL